MCIVMNSCHFTVDVVTTKCTNYSLDLLDHPFLCFKKSAPPEGHG
jgi:hypothetical protein